MEYGYLPLLKIVSKSFVSQIVDDASLFFYILTQYSDCNVFKFYSDQVTISRVIVCATASANSNISSTKILGKISFN